MHTLRSLYSLGLLTGMTVASAPLLLCSLAAQGFCDPHRLRTGKNFRRIGAFSAKLLPGWQFELIGPIPKRLPPRAVVVCNHQSHLDSFLLANLPWEMKWVAKASLFKVPFLGWSMALAGDIPLNRQLGRHDTATWQKARAYLEAHVPVFMFPEGTRSPDGQLQAFKMGAFHLAIAAQAAIVPCALHGTCHGWQKNSWKLQPTCASVCVGAPIDTTGMLPQDAANLRDTVHQTIETMLAGLQA